MTVEKISFSSNCKWDSQIRDISEKAWPRLNLLRALKFSRKSLEKMYIAYIRPLLEDSDSVWDNCSHEAKRQLEDIHTEAARIITGATKLCSIEKLLLDLGLESLQSRRNKHKLVLFYKTLNGLNPSYLTDLVPPCIQETSRYSLRNSDHIQNYRANSNIFLESFFPPTVRSWSNLPLDTKQATSVAAFKHCLNRNLQ